MKYAVRVPLAADDYIFVSDIDSPFDIKVRLFDSEEEAKEHAAIWGPLAEVVEYKEEDAE
jgi:hypothetical protein